MDNKTNIKQEDITRVKAMGFLWNKGTECFNGRVITRNGKITAEECNAYLRLLRSSATAI